MQAIERDPDVSQLAPLQRSIEKEPDAGLRARKETLVRLLTARFGERTEARVAAIDALADSLSVETRAALNPIVTTTRRVFETPPDGLNIARTLKPGSDVLPMEEAYALLVAADFAPTDSPPRAKRSSTTSPSPPRAS